MSCGGETLQTFLDRAGGNATYTLIMAAVVCEGSRNMDGRVSTQAVHKAPLFSIMADECTDVTTELTICCRWVESGVLEEHFIEILLLKKVNAENIYSALVEYCREKNIQLGRLIGMGFDGAATFSGDRQNWSSKKVEIALSACIVCPLSLSCPSTGFCASC